MGDRSGSVRRALGYRPGKGYVNITGHGHKVYDVLSLTSDEAGNITFKTLSPEEVYEWMLSKGYKPGTPIQLNICHSGRWAQKIANLSGAKVGATFGRVQSLGVWNNFIPNPIDKSELGINSNSLPPRIKHFLF